MAGVACARRIVRAVLGSEQDHSLVLEFPPLLDTPLPGRHLMGVGENVYEGSRQVRSGQGSIPVPFARQFPCRAFFPTFLALDRNAASGGSRARGTTIKEFAP